VSARGATDGRSRRRAATLARTLGLAMLLSCATGRAAGADGDAAPNPVVTAAPDSAVAAQADSLVKPRPRGPVFQPGLDRDRIEIGAGPVRGYFDAVGSFGYRRYVRERRGWAQFVVGELSGAKKDYLTEGVGSVYYLFRNRRAWRRDRRVRPILEGGPGLHLAVQSAHLVGFNERPFHAKVFFKVHAYAGVEALVTPRMGLLLRGRMSVPDHRPLDYAQAAIFFR
jgi:hypothetical protein